MSFVLVILIVSNVSCNTLFYHVGIAILFVIGVTYLRHVVYLFDDFGLSSILGGDP